MEIKKRFVLAFFALTFALPFAFCQKSPADESAADSFVQGLVCYKEKAWTDASVFLRQAADSEEYSTDSTWFMIIMSLVYSEDFSSAVNSCDYFISSFSESPLLPAVEYQRGSRC